MGNIEPAIIFLIVMAIGVNILVSIAVLDGFKESHLEGLQRLGVALLVEGAMGFVFVPNVMQ